MTQTVSPGGELLLLLDEVIDEARSFLGVHSELGNTVPAEDYDGEVNAVAAAVAHLRSLLRSFAFKYDDSAESVDLRELIRKIEDNEVPRGFELTCPKSLPVLHVNRRRIEGLFSFLIRDIVASKATKAAISVSKNGRFKVSDNRPKGSHRKGDDHFGLTFKDENGRLRSNLGLHLAREIVGFYGGGISVSFNSKSVEVEFTLPIEG